MPRLSRLSLAALLSAAATAAAQPGLYGIDFTGNVIRIDRVTGVGTLVGNSGFSGSNAAAADAHGHIFTTNSASDQLILVDPATGAGSLFIALTNRPASFGVRGMAFAPDGRLFVAMSQALTTTIDILATIDLTTGAYATVGPTGRTDIQGLACDPAGTLYASGVFGGLYTLDSTTGAATVIGGTLSGDDQSLEFDDHGTLYACRANLRTVDPATGLATLVGPTGFNDIRGTAFVSAQNCYANCDQSTTPPVLNINDFVCFQALFAAGDPAANCDGSTNAPILNVNDFVCFQAAFAAGCN